METKNKKNPHVKLNSSGDAIIYPMPFAEAWEICNNCVSKDNNYKEHAKCVVNNTIQNLEYILCQLDNDMPNKQLKEYIQKGIFSHKEFLKL